VGEELKVRGITLKRKDTGNMGEQLALNFLKKKGFRILETNYRCPRGEIDIIAWQKDCLVFVEVRTKANPAFGSPEESITSTKKKHLIQSANYYLQEQEKMPLSWRIDVVAVEMEADNRLSRIELIENAVEGN
jgi:putative endonuclease